MEFDALFQTCVGSKSTTHDVQSIILTHEHFITSEQLFDVLIHGFFESEDIVQFRVVNFIKKWLDLSPAAFDETLPLGKRLLAYFEELEKKRPEAMKVFQQAPIYLKNSPGDVPAEETTTKTLRSCFPLSEFSPRAVAAYLVFRDHYLLSEVNTNELLKQRWLKPEQSPTLKACSDRIDRLVYWTVYKIANAPHKFRLKILDFYLKVCEQLLAFQDFNALFGVFLGLMKLSDFSLGCLWKKSKNIDLYLKLKQICDYNNNFFTYRNLIKTLTFPLIEFQEIVLKDMLNITEGLPDEIDGALNVDKMLAMGKVIQRFNKSKSTKFEICNLSVGGGELDILLNEIDNGPNWQDAVDKLREEFQKSEASKANEKKEKDGADQSKEQPKEQTKEQTKEHRRAIKSMSIQKSNKGSRGRSGTLAENVSFSPNLTEENRNSPNNKAKRFRNRAGTMDSVSAKKNPSNNDDGAIEQDQLQWDSLITDLETNKESTPILNLAFSPSDESSILYKSKSSPLQPKRNAVGFTSSSGALLSPKSASTLETRSRSSSTERTSYLTPTASNSDIFFDNSTGPEVNLNFRSDLRSSVSTVTSASSVSSVSSVHAASTTSDNERSDTAGIFELKLS